MNSIKHFSWQRLGLFIKSDLAINASKIFIFSLTVLSLHVLINLTLSPADDNLQLFPFAFVLYGGGCWLTSRSFADLHSSERKQNFLLLPATNLEKLLGRLLLTTIGYMASIVLIFYISSLLISGLNWLFFDKISAIFHLTHKKILSELAIYISCQSVFFLGAVYFKSSNFSKTILSLCGLILGFYLTASRIFTPLLEVNFFYGWQRLAFHNVTINLIFALVPPCAWLIAYLRLCESEL